MQSNEGVSVIVVDMFRDNYLLKPNLFYNTSKVNRHNPIVLPFP